MTSAIASEAAASVASQKPRSLVVFSDDWGRHPSSCQHLISKLLPSYHVMWVNTIGTRGPRLDLATLRRAAGKAQQWLGKRRLTPPASQEDVATSNGPRVLSPIMWPWFRRPFDRWLNRRLLSRSINRELVAAPQPLVAVTAIPLTADLIGQLNVDAWVYYCVDDLAAWPGLDSLPLREMEQQQVKEVDALVAVSSTLQNRLSDMGRESTLVSHGVDLNHWRTSSAIRELVLPNATTPMVVFWGLIDERLETDWVLSLADQLEDGSIVLAGPIETLPTELSSHRRIHTPGPIPYDSLPALAQQAAALIMPYRDIDATRAMQPLKLKEYMATGLPCIVRRLPATTIWEDSIDLVDTCEGFVATTLRRLESGMPEGQSCRRKRLDDESWDAKAMMLRQVLEHVTMSNDRRQPGNASCNQ